MAPLASAAWHLSSAGVSEPIELFQGFLLKPGKPRTVRNLRPMVFDWHSTVQSFGPTLLFLCPLNPAAFDVFLMLTLVERH